MYELDRQTVFRLLVYKTGVFFIEQRLPGSQEAVTLPTVLSVYSHFWATIVNYLNLSIPTARVIELGMKLSSVPKNGIVSSPFFECTSPQDVASGSSHFDVEEKSDILPKEFFQKFLYGLLEQLGYLDFEDGIGEIEFV